MRRSGLRRCQTPVTFNLKCRCYIGYYFLHMFQLCTCKPDKEMHIVEYVDCNKLRNLEIGLVKYSLKDY